MRKKESKIKDEELETTIEETLENNSEETPEETSQSEDENTKVDEEEVQSIESILKEKLKKAEEEVKLLNNKLSASEDQFIRLSAEYDNFRKRTAKEKEGIYIEACADILKELLPVLDNLERAMTVDGNLEEFKKGIDMVIKGYKTSLEKLGVEEIPTDGEFDPNVHNAVMHIDDPNYDKNSIAEVFMKGYKKNDKVLRHSMVKVAN